MNKANKLAKKWNRKPYKPKTRMRMTMAQLRVAKGIAA